MSNSPYDPQSNASSPYQQSQQHNPYGPGAGQPSGEQNPYQQQAHSPYDAPQPGGQPTHTSDTDGSSHGQGGAHPAQPQPPAADDGDATVMAPAGWNQPAAQQDDDVTVLAPSGWSGSSEPKNADEDDSTVLAPSSWTESAAGGGGAAPNPTGGMSAYQPGGQPSADPYAQPSATDPYSQPSAPGYGQGGDPYSQQSAPGFAASANDPYSQPSAQPVNQFGGQGQFGPGQPYAEPQGFQQNPYGAPAGQPMGGPMSGPMGMGAVDQNGMLIQGSVPSQLSPQEERSQASMAHWLAILIQWIGPLIILMTSGEKSPWVKQHAKQSMNLELTLLIGYVISIFLMFIGIGLLTYPVVWVLGLVFHIMGAQAAGRGENYKCPMAIQILK